MFRMILTLVIASISSISLAQTPTQRTTAEAPSPQGAFSANSQAASANQPGWRVGVVDAGEKAAGTDKLPDVISYLPSGRPQVTIGAARSAGILLSNSPGYIFEGMVEIKEPGRHVFALTIAPPEGREPTLGGAAGSTLQRCDTAFYFAGAVVGSGTRQIGGQEGVPARGTSLTATVDIPTPGIYPMQAYAACRLVRQGLDTVHWKSANPAVQWHENTVITVQGRSPSEAQLRPIATDRVRHAALQN